MQLPSQHHYAGLWLLLTCLFLGVPTARSESPVSEMQPQLQPTPCDAESQSPGDYCTLGSLSLKKTSFEVAGDVCSFSIPNRPAVCLVPLLKKLGSMPDRCGAGKVDELLLRQKITELMMTASLDVEGFLAEIDNESNHVRAVKDALTQRQAKALSRSLLWNNVGTGGGAVGSALSIPARTATAGAWVGAIFGGIGSVFGFVNYFQTLKSPEGCFPSPSSDGRCTAFKADDCPERGKAKSGCSPSMLYHILAPQTDAQTEAGLFHSRYDAMVGSYLTERKEELIENWREIQANDPKETVEKMTSSHDRPAKLSVDEMTDRQTMLIDLRALVSRMSRDLSRLSNVVNTGMPECQAGNGN